MSLGILPKEWTLHKQLPTYPMKGIVSKSAWLAPKSDPGATSVSLFLKNVHNSPQNEKIGKVTKFRDPNFSIEWAVLEKPSGGYWSPCPPPRIGLKLDGRV